VEISPRNKTADAADLNHSREKREKEKEKKNEAHIVTDGADIRLRSYTDGIYGPPPFLISQSDTKFLFYCERNPVSARIKLPLAKKSQTKLGKNPGEMTNRNK